MPPYVAKPVPFPNSVDNLHFFRDRKRKGPKPHKKRNRRHGRERGR